MGVEDILTQKVAKLLDSSNSFFVPMHNFLTNKYSLHFEQVHVGNDLHLMMWTRIHVLVPNDGEKEDIM